MNQKCHLCGRETDQWNLAAHAAGHCQKHVHVALSGGAHATVSPDCPPSTLAALAAVAKIAAEQARSATTETDRLRSSLESYGFKESYVAMLSHARKLEHERDAAIKNVEVIAESHKWCSIRLEKAEAALREIAKQKILDEVEDPVCCDFEDGYTQCVEVARSYLSSENTPDNPPR